MMENTNLESYADIYAAIGRLAVRYSVKQRQTMQMIGLTADDLASEAFCRFIKYNKSMMEMPYVQYVLLCRVTFRHFADIVWKYTRVHIVEQEYAQHIKHTQSRASPLDGLPASELRDSLSEVYTTSPLERGILDLIYSPEPYWKWAQSVYSDAKFPNVNRLAAYFTVSAYHVRKALTNLEPLL